MKHKRNIVLLEENGTSIENMFDNIVLKENKRNKNIKLVNKDNYVNKFLKPNHDYQNNVEENFFRPKSDFKRYEVIQTNIRLNYKEKDNLISSLMRCDRRTADITNDKSSSKSNYFEGTIIINKTPENIKNSLLTDNCLPQKTFYIKTTNYQPSPKSKYSPQKPLQMMLISKNSLQNIKNKHSSTAERSNVKLKENKFNILPNLGIKTENKLKKNANFRTVATATDKKIQQLENLIQLSKSTVKEMNIKIQSEHKQVDDFVNKMKRFEYPLSKPMKKFTIFSKSNKSNGKV